jgi:hypothetical protein
MERFALDFAETEHKPAASGPGETPGTGTYRDDRRDPPTMSPTVDDLRNEIRTAVGRYERLESTAFTKEALAAVCAEVGADIGEGRLPPKSEMRAAIRERVDGLETGESVADRPFRKAELETIAAALGVDLG